MIQQTLLHLTTDFDGIGSAINKSALTRCILFSIALALKITSLVQILANKSVIVEVPALHFFGLRPAHF